MFAVLIAPAVIPGFDTAVVSIVVALGLLALLPLLNWRQKEGAMVAGCLALTIAWQIGFSVCEIWWGWFMWCF